MSEIRPSVKLWATHSHRFSNSTLQLMAVALGLAPFYGFIFWSHATREQPYSLQDLFVYPLVVGSLGIIWLIFLFTTFCGETLRSLNLKEASWSRDALLAILLTIIAFSWRVVESLTVARWIPPSPPAPEILNLLFGVAQNPWLLALWLGPVVWIGVAAFEELSRVFMLNRLWSISGHPLARWSALFLSAALFGLAHLYQGTLGALSVGVLGLIWGLGYLAWGRVWPLIIAHALFDSIQLGIAVLQIRGSQ